MLVERWLEPPPGHRDQIEARIELGGILRKVRRRREGAGEMPASDHRATREEVGQPRGLREGTFARPSCRPGVVLFASGAPLSAPAWKSKPSYYLVASDDHMIPPPAQHKMAQRAGSTVVETAGSHAVYVSKPEAVAALIEQAAAAE